MISEVTLRFLEAIAKNNNTEWMHTHIDLYRQERKNFELFITKRIDALGKINPHIEEIPVKECLFRFNKDIRFSKDKNPYKLSFGAYVTPEGRKTQLSGLYLHIQPGDKSMIAGGAYFPSTANRNRLHTHIAKNYKRFIKIIQNKDFVKWFGDIHTDQPRKILPKGITRDHPAAHWLRYGNYFVEKIFTDKQVLAKDFFDKIMQASVAMQPLNDFFNEVLI